MRKIRQLLLVVKEDYKFRYFYRFLYSRGIFLRKFYKFDLMRRHFNLA